MKKMSFNVPDGYFESLQDRLSEVSRNEARPRLYRKTSLYMAVAAGLAAVIVAGGFFLDLIPVSDPEAVFMAAVQDSNSYADPAAARYVDSATDYDQEGNDAMEYLIYSGISAEDVALILSEDY